MATAPVLEIVQEPSTDIAVIVQRTPAVVLTGKDQRVSLYAHIEREIADFEPDVSSKKGRDAIKALAFKITKTKTAIDAAGKQLNEEARAKIGVVDEARRDARNTLEILAERVRAPLTAWEQAEEARVAFCRADIDEFKRAGIVTPDDTAATVRDRGMDLWNHAIDPERFGDMAGEAEETKAASVETLKAALVRLTREEADRAELDKLRAEAAERAAREQAERDAAAQAAAEAVEAQRQKDRIAQREREDAERIAAAERAAEQRAREASEAAAQAERDRIQREHDKALAEERSKVAAERAAIEQERANAARIENERLAKEAHDRARAKQLADEQAAREADKAHRTRVKTAAKQAIMTCGVSEEVAQKVVLAIIAGEIPNVALGY